MKKEKENQNEVEVLEADVSLENEIQGELIKYNVTDAVIASLKEKFLPLVERGKITNKEEFSEVVDARKECKTWRVTTTKICKKGREKAVLVQKAWIKKEGEVIGQISEVEEPLEKLEDEWTAEQERIKSEKKRMQEEQLANRQQDLSKMGVLFYNGSFELGDVSYEYALVKESDDATYLTIFNAFKAVYDANEAERLRIEKEKQEAAAELQRQKDELVRQQNELKEQQAEVERQKKDAYDKEQVRLAMEENVRIAAKEKLFKEMLSKLKGWAYNGYTVSNRSEIFGSKEYLVALPEKEFETLISENNIAIQKEEKLAEEKRLAEIERIKQEAIKQEQLRQEEEQRQLSIKQQQEAAKKAEEMAQASDKVKFADLIKQFNAIKFPDMRSGQYRKKVVIIREKMDEINAL